MKPSWFSLCRTGLFLLLVQRAAAIDPAAPGLAIPQPGDQVLHVLSPNLLELVRINSKQPDPAHVDSWDWIDASGNFTPDLSSIRVIVNGQTNSVTAVGFKRRPIYAPQATW